MLGLADYEHRSIGFAVYHLVLITVLKSDVVLAPEGLTSLETDTDTKHIAL